ncbi:MAG: MBL fold metallo-hydrolase [Thermoguttaceae bacterium]|jgi:glyoxylase-like metal-dependent hydrolase (beta-lactamase superfamily II)|nr:MBL fold metallo-hydrolase [Thermoguttaceae bacterium]
MLIDNPPVEVADSVWMLGTTAYPVYLVRGRNEGMIIEGGIGAIEPLLRRQLDELDVASEYVRQVVVMHAHPDHVMAIPLLRELFPGVVVAASEPAAATLSIEKAIGYFTRIDADLTAGLNREGMIAESPPPVAVPGNRIAIDRTVAEGDVIAVEDFAFSVLETPGHSDCSISLHEADRRVLVISDASGFYIPAKGTWWPGYFTSYPQYLNSMERLASLDAETLCLSHFGAVRGQDEVRDYLTGAIAATRQYHERIIAETKAGRSAREIAEALGAEIYHLRPILPLDFFQKNCAVMVKQSLKHEDEKGSGAMAEKP